MLGRMGLATRLSIECSPKTVPARLQASARMASRPAPVTYRVPSSKSSADKRRRRRAAADSDRRNRADAGVHACDSITSWITLIHWQKFAGRGRSQMRPSCDELIETAFDFSHEISIVKNQFALCGLKDYRRANRARVVRVTIFATRN